MNIQRQFQKGSSFLQNLFYLAGIGSFIVAVLVYHDAKNSSKDKQSNTTQDVSENTVQATDQEVKKEPIVKTEVAEPKPPKPKGTKIGHYTAYTNGTAVDNETGMMWDRCSIGQEWDSDELTCTGEAQRYNWQEAFKEIEKLNANNHLGYSDWQLPHIEDLSNLRYCSTGFKGTETIPTKDGGTKEVEDWCKGDDYQKPTINTVVFPNIASYKNIVDRDFSPYWSSSPYAYNNYNAWVVYFNFGYGNGNGKIFDNFVRAVRSE